MINKILAAFIITGILTISLSSAVDYSSGSKLSVSSLSSSSNSAVKDISSTYESGNPYKTQWGWDGENCVKRPLVSHRALVRKDRNESIGVVWIRDGEYNSLFEYRRYLIPGTRAIAYKEDGKTRASKAECDTSVLESRKLLYVRWWSPTANMTA